LAVFQEHGVEKIGVSTSEKKSIAVLFNGIWWPETPDDLKNVSILIETLFTFRYKNRFGSLAIQTQSCWEEFKATHLPLVITMDYDGRGTVIGHQKMAASDRRPSSERALSSNRQCQIIYRKCGEKEPATYKVGKNWVAIEPIKKGTCWFKVPADEFYSGTVLILNGPESKAQRKYHRGNSLRELEAWN